MSSISGISGASSYLYGQIASGNRLTSASRGAAELAISEKQKAQATGYDVGTNNLKSGQNVLNVTDGALSSITDNLQRIRELAIQAKNTTMSGSDRQSIQEEIDQMKQGIQDIATQTQFNTMNLLDGSRGSGIQIAAGSGTDTLTINNSVNTTLDALGIKDFDVTKSFDLTKIDDALKKVSDSRSQAGAQFNRLDNAINYNSYASYNTVAARSRIADTDYSQASSELKKQQTLQTYAIMMQKKQMEMKARSVQNFWL